MTLELDTSFSFVGVNEFGVVIWNKGYFLVPTTKRLHFGLYTVDNVFLDMVGWSLPKCALLFAILRQAADEAGTQHFMLLDADYIDPDYLMESERKWLLKKRIIFWRK